MTTKLINKLIKPFAKLNIQEPDSGCFPPPPARDSLDSLSDKELLTILSLLPLSELLRLEIVSKRFQSIVWLIYPREKSLRLIQNPTNQENLIEIGSHHFFTNYHSEAPFEELCIPVTGPLTSDSIQGLAARFPNVTHLALYYVDHIRLEQLLELLKSYPNLESLKLFCTEEQKREFFVDRFWTTLEPLKLQQIRLPFDGDSQDALRGIAPDGYPIFGSVELPSWIQPEVVINNDNLRRVAVGPDGSSVGHLVLNDSGSIYSFTYQTRFRNEYGHVMARFGLHADPETNQISFVKTGIRFTPRSGYDNWRPAWYQFRSTTMTNVTHIEMYLKNGFYFHAIYSHIGCVLHNLTHLRLIQDPVNSKHKVGQELQSVVPFQSVNGHPMRYLRFLCLTNVDLHDASFIEQLPVIFPLLTTIHFENCCFKEAPEEWLVEVLETKFDHLSEIWSNYQTMYQKERDEGKLAEKIKELFLKSNFCSAISDKKFNPKNKFLNRLFCP